MLKYLTIKLRIVNLDKFEVIYKENKIKIQDKKRIKKELEGILGAGNVSTEEIDLMAYSKLN